MDRKSEQISVVVPVYNEEKNIRPFLLRLEPVLEKIAHSYEIIFVLDPCADQTESIIVEEAQRNPVIRLLVMSRRFGQPAATMAGLLRSSRDYCVVIDVDLQDPPELIEDLYKEALKGYEVVYATRRSRTGENYVKKKVSSLGYWLINKLSEVPILPETGDFRIMSRRVIEELSKLNESHAFLRGLVAYVGFPQSRVLFDRD